MDRFPVDVQKPLNEYVYALVDQTCGVFASGAIFYVGKGTGDRCFQHAKGALDPSGGETIESLKLRRIGRIIVQTGAAPEIRIIAHGLTRDQAHVIEAAFIGLLPDLTNRVSGHHADRYWLSPSQIIARYSDPLKPSDVGMPFLLVSLNGGGIIPPYPEIAHDPEVLARRTLGDWGLSVARAREVAFVIGVYRGLIRTVAQVDKVADGSSAFQENPGERPRARRRITFAGARRSDLEVRWGERRIIDPSGHDLTVFPPRHGCRFVAV